jgi:hypothetical protein
MHAAHVHQLCSTRSPISSSLHSASVHFNSLHFSFFFHPLAPLVRGAHDTHARYVTHFAAISKIIANPDPFIAELVAKAAAVGLDGFDIDYEPQNDEKVCSPRNGTAIAAPCMVANHSLAHATPQHHSPMRTTLTAHRHCSRCTQLLLA